MITKEKIIEVFDNYATGVYNAEITRDDLDVFALEIEALSKVNNVVSDDVIKWQMHMKVEKIETLKLSESMTNKQIDEYFENACGGVYKWWRE
jgi:hypothetical protein